MFAINTRAQELGTDDVKNKLRTLFAGRKTDLVIGNIAKTFRALCDYADFAGTPAPRESQEAPPAAESKPQVKQEEGASLPPPKTEIPHGKLSVSALQYHINVVLPDTRDQAVYDAIFKSLREHLG